MTEEVQEEIEKLVGMGFEEEEVYKAYYMCGRDIDAARSILLDSKGIRPLPLVSNTHNNNDIDGNTPKRTRRQALAAKKRSEKGKEKVTETRKGKGKGKGKAKGKKKQGGSKSNDNPFIKSSSNKSSLKKSAALSSKRDEQESFLGGSRVSPASASIRASNLFLQNQHQMQQDRMTPEQIGGLAAGIAAVGAIAYFCYYQSK